ncbi:related to dihydrofolate reductase [Cephalotrichum gorgonifer]|uniref:Related to dihydrofolate reductase n=1 Tax=Cephalotrichum gorgonifer TaxID=2041049 RepID=A0AAE8MU60_9PEZI|nr:related to dihydrofolate reductase [Cephalotrichum gorgonifer]
MSETPAASPRPEGAVPTPAPTTSTAPPARKANMNQQRPKAPPVPKKELKVLMLHGYTQSGPLFRAKTRALEKLLIKTLNPQTTSLTLTYPTAPIRLRATDIPGYAPPAPADGATADPDDEIDSWAWFRRDHPAAPTLRGLDLGMSAVASAIAEAGGVHGIVGFSQGGALAALVTAALEKPHREVPAEHAPWVEALRAANGGEALRFAIIYSGFWMGVDDIAWCYEPKIETPTLHYIGGLDTVVSEERSNALVERCEAPLVAAHPGGHYVPISKEWVMPIAGFMRRFVDVEGEKEEARI